MFDQRVVIVDTETTSLDPLNRVTWDLGMVVREVDGTYTSHQYFVDLSNREIERADQESLDIGGFDTRYNELEAMSRSTVAHIVHDLTDGAILAGIAVDFDAENLRNMLHTVGLTPKWDHRLLDIRTLAFGYMRAQQGPNFEGTWAPSQDEIAEYLGVDIITDSKRHTAIGDAEYAADILKNLIWE